MRKKKERQHQSRRDKRERGREIMMLREKYEGKKEKASMNIDKN